LSPHVATTAIYTLSLHDALPISRVLPSCRALGAGDGGAGFPLVQAHRDGGVDEGALDCAGVFELGALERLAGGPEQAPVPLSGVDRKSTRLNSSHVKISYAVFCL